MGQKTSRQAAKESFSSTLNLPLHDSSCKNDSKKCHTFLSVVSSSYLFFFFFLIRTHSNM